MTRFHATPVERRRPQLLFSPDYGADPLWELPSERMVNLDSLPLSDTLRDDVRDRAAGWEELARQELEADGMTAGQVADGAGEVADEQWQEIDERGRALWRDLQRELAGQYVVGRAEFRDVPVRHVQWVDGGTVEPCPPAPE